MVTPGRIPSFRAVRTHPHAVWYSRQHQGFRGLTAGGPQVSSGHMSMNPLEVGPEPLHPDDVVAVAREGRGVRLSAAAQAAIAATREAVDELAAGDEPVYGVSTGFGALATRHIAAAGPRAAAAQPDPLARRRRRPGGRARGGPGADAAAAAHPGHRPHRRPARDRRRLRRDAERRDHPGRPRVRLARLLRRPGPAVALSRSR